MALEAFKVIEQAKAFELELKVGLSSATNLGHMRGAHLLRIKEALDSVQVSEELMKIISPTIQSIQDSVDHNFTKSTIEDLIEGEVETVLQYYTSTDTTYLLVVKNNIGFYAFENIKAEVEAFKSITNNPEPPINWLNQFSQLGKKLYHNIIPTEITPVKGNVLVLPDGYLYGLNFEIIPTDDCPTLSEKCILLAKADISYGYSYLSSAPESQLSTNELLAASLWKESGSSGLTSLGDGTVVLKKIKATLEPSSMYKLSSISSSTFKQIISEFDVLYMHTHGSFIDGQACVLLHDNLGNIDTLWGNEIKSLDNPPSLVLLNVCLSGLGSISYSEGMENLAYNFLYAGSQAAIVGNNYLPTEIASKIILSGLSKWKEGKSLSSALSQAKREFISKEADPLLRHPAYWSGLMIYGQRASGKKDSNWSYYILPGLLIVLVIAGLRRQSRTA